jgi:hypothetical protein
MVFLAQNTPTPLVPGVAYFPLWKVVLKLSFSEDS